MLVIAFIMFVGGCGMSNNNFDGLFIETIRVESDTFKKNDTVSFSITMQDVEGLNTKLKSKYDYDE